MTTAPTSSSSPAGTTTATAPDAGARGPLRLRLRDTFSRRDDVDGVWWPRSRVLQTEAADLIDHLPASVGYVNRLHFSPPDWDDVVADGRGVRNITAARGRVKTGSYPGDDTHVMVLVLATGQRLWLSVVPSSATEQEADEAFAVLERSDDTGSPSAGR